MRVLRVLVVEDDEELSEAIAAELADAGHDVQCEADGEAAWAALAQGPVPDVILLDLNLPGMDGRTLRRRQLDVPRLAHVPTIVVTGQPLDDWTQRALRSSVLKKPFRVEMLLEALQKISLEQHGPKVCACGRFYDDAAWRSLPALGETDNGREAGERIELRLCACGSTLARAVGTHALSIRIPRAVVP